MKVAISAMGSTQDAQIDPRFGRCRYFIIADPETMKLEVSDNTSAMSSGGAGISAAQMIVGKGVEAVLTGNCGPNAYQVLSAAGIQVLTGVSGKVKDAIEGYRSGKFQASSSANVPDHFGAGATQNTGGGMGRGMGMGHGAGRGIRGGMGAGFTSAPSAPAAGVAPQPHAPKEEVEALKTQSQALAEQLIEIQRRIEELDKK